jgi:Zn-dependent alcohol dehydrogenase
MSKHSLGSRRFVIAIVGIISCLGLGVYTKDVSVASSIAIICVGIAGAAAIDGLKKKD